MVFENILSSRGLKQQCKGGTDWNSNVIENENIQKFAKNFKKCSFTSRNIDGNFDASEFL